MAEKGRFEERPFSLRQQLIQRIFAVRTAAERCPTVVKLLDVGHAYAFRNERGIIQSA
jgi:hypothetical protein